MFEEYSILISAIALVISIISLTISYRQYKRTIVATIKHELRNLPPYTSNEEETTIIVKNIGNAVAKIESTHLTFSWDKNLIVNLEYGVEEGLRRLNPDEEWVFHKRLPEPSKDGLYTITIVTKYDGREKEEKIRFQVIIPSMRIF